MNKQQEYGEVTNSGILLTSAYSGETVEEDCEPLTVEDALEPPLASQTGQGTIAYEILLLQQRLAAYERLYIEEMAELRGEIERLRRAFLQETNPDLRSLSSVRRTLESRS